MGLFRWIGAGIGMETGRKVVDAVERQLTDGERAEQEARQRKRKLIAVAILSLVGLVLILALLKKVFFWALGLALVCGLAYAGWALLGPQISEFFAKQKQRKQAADSRRQAENAQQNRAKKIEDELADLKRDLGGE